MKQDFYISFGGPEIGVPDVRCSINQTYRALIQGFCFQLFVSKKTSHLTALFNAAVLKRIRLRILIVTYKYS